MEPGDLKKARDEHKHKTARQPPGAVRARPGYGQGRNGARRRQNQGAQDPKRADCVRLHRAGAKRQQAQELGRPQRHAHFKTGDEDPDAAHHADGVAHPRAYLEHAQGRREADSEGEQQPYRVVAGDQIGEGRQKIAPVHSRQFCWLSLKTSQPQLKFIVKTTHFLRKGLAPLSSGSR